MVKILIFFVTFASLLSLSSNVFVFQMTSFKCSSSNKTLSSYKCFAKSYSRTHSTFNILFNITRPLTNVKAHVDIQMKSITPFYNSVINTTLDICGFLNGTSKNIATKWFFDIMTSSFPPGYIHPCPYIGELKGTNLTLNVTPQTPQFLLGTYKALLRYFDDKDDNIISSLHVIDLKDVRVLKSLKKKDSQI